MAKKVYAGVNNIAQEANKMYVGVNDVARKVKKAYVGINDIAKEVFNGTPSIEVLDLPTAKREHTTCTVGDYALIAGGVGDNSVITYNSSLTRGTATGLNETTDTNSIPSTQTPNGAYAVFRGSKATAYDGSLTRSTPNSSSTSRIYGVAGILGIGSSTRAMFIGYYSNSNIETWSNSLTYSTSSSTYNGGTGRYAAAANLNNKAIVAGGYSTYSSGIYYSDVCTIDYSGMIRQNNLTPLTYAVRNLAGCSTGSYAFFAGGYNSNAVYNTTNAYNTSFTKVWADPLVEPRYSFRLATAINGKALFGGGKNGNEQSSAYVDVYDDSLTHSLANDLSISRYDSATVAIGNYILFTGGNKITSKGEMGNQSVEVYDKNLNKIK